jgi:hypothetical protein
MYLIPGLVFWLTLVADSKSQVINQTEKSIVW